MTPRFLVIFLAVFAALLFAEWFQFLRGFDTSSWPASNWLLFAFVILAEGVAVAIITRTVDRSLPDSGGRVAKDTRQPKRSSSRR